jgi:hypothetical protein
MVQDVPAAFGTTSASSGTTMRGLCAQGGKVMITCTKIFTVGTVALLFAAGCESAADQQRKADSAQAEANAKAQEAQRDADTNARHAQADADREIADAQEKFSKMREEFRHDLESKLVDVDKEIAGLRSSALTKTGKEKVKLESNLPIIEQRRTSVKEAFEQLEHASASTWDQAKGEVEKRWKELKSSVDAAT